MNYLILLVIILCIDSIYLMLMRSTFAAVILKIQKKPVQINYLGIVITYAAIVIVLNHFIISTKKTAFDAFVLGACIYAVYDFTTLSILKDYPLGLAIMDTLWGGTLFYLTTRVFRYVALYT